MCAQKCMFVSQYMAMKLKTECGDVRGEAGVGVGDRLYAKHESISAF